MDEMMSETSIEVYPPPGPFPDKDAKIEIESSYLMDATVKIKTSEGEEEDKYTNIGNNDLVHLMLNGCGTIVEIYIETKERENDRK